MSRCDLKMKAGDLVELRLHPHIHTKGVYPEYGGLPDRLWTEGEVCVVLKDSLPHDLVQVFYRGRSGWIPHQCMVLINSKLCEDGK